MKKLGMIAALLMAATAYSAENGDDGFHVGFGGFGGVALPIGALADNLGTGPTFGGKILLTGIIPKLPPWAELEVVIAHNLGATDKSGYASKAETGGDAVPDSTFTPVSAGLNFKKMGERIGVYLTLGGGFYLKTEGGAKEIETPEMPEIVTGEGDINKPGTYLGFGLLIKLPLGLILDVAPRVNYVWNGGTYNVKGEGFEFSMPKDFNDAFVTVTGGVDYYVF